MYICQKRGYKYYHYKIGEKIRVKGHYTKKVKVSPIGRKYVEVKKKYRKNSIGMLNEKKNEGEKRDGKSKENKKANRKN